MDRRLGLTALLAIPGAILLFGFGCNNLSGLADLKNVDCVGDCAPHDDTGATGDDGTDSEPDVVDAPPGTCKSNPDPTNAASACGPKDFGELTCTPFDAGPDSGCENVGTKCAALTKNDVSSDLINLRITHLQFWYPNILRKVGSALIHPQTNAKCTGGQEVLNLLLQLDGTQRKMKVGSARPTTDGVTFSFLNQLYAPTAFSSACPGATRVPPAALEIKPFFVPYTISGPNIATEVMPRMYIASFDTTKEVPSIVPIVDVSLKKIVITPDRNCIGSYDPIYGCPDNESLGWTTGGLIVGKIPLEEADNIPVPIGGCQSLCAVLADNPALVEGNNCKRGSDGKIIEFGDTCVGSSGCKNAMWVSAAFSAHAVKIE